MGKEIVFLSLLIYSLQTLLWCGAVPRLSMTDSPGLYLTRKTHGSSLEDNIDLDVDSDSDEERFHSPITEKKKIENCNDFDDVEGV